MSDLSIILEQIINYQKLLEQAVKDGDQKEVAKILNVIDVLWSSAREIWSEFKK